MRLVTELIHDIPAWAIGPASVLAFVVPAMIGLWLAHRGIYPRLRLGETLIDNGVIGWFFAGVLTISLIAGAVLGEGTSPAAPAAPMPPVVTPAPFSPDPST